MKTPFFSFLVSVLPYLDFNPSLFYLIHFQGTIKLEHIQYGASKRQVRPFWVFTNGVDDLIDCWLSAGCNKEDDLKRGRSGGWAGIDDRVWF